MQIGQTCVLGAALAYPVWQEQNILLFEQLRMHLKTDHHLKVCINRRICSRGHTSSSSSFLVTQPCECHPFISVSLALSALFVNRKCSSHQPFIKNTAERIGNLAKIRYTVPDTNSFFCYLMARIWNVQVAARMTGRSRRITKYVPYQYGETRDQL